MDTNHLLAQLGRAWTSYGGVTELGLALVLVIGLVWQVTRAVRRGKLGTLLLVAEFIAVVVIDGQGMFGVLTGRFHFPIELAISAFFFFQVIMAQAIMRAKTRFEEHGSAGGYGTVVWLTALISGALVAGNATSWDERFGRLAIPILFTASWWIDLTGSRPRRSTSRFVYSPYNLLEMWGLVEASEGSTAVMSRRDRLIRRA